jgi:hypothetical protein
MLEFLAAACDLVRELYESVLLSIEDTFFNRD